MRQGIIAAVSTPPGKGGVAIIRMCGDGSYALAERVFRARSGKPLSHYPQRMQVYGYLTDGDEVVDDGLVTKFDKGSSYTGEETVEFSIHGGILVTERVLELLFTNGAIPAEGGEFTRLAFINGRLSLTEVEAIGDLLDAKSEEQLKLFSGKSRERLKNKIAELRTGLTTLLGSVYARIDYPEEDLGDLSDDEIIDELLSIRESLVRLISTYRTGRSIKEGIRAVLIGKPNAGKSTLYNLIVGEDAAIVTDIPGTTRDLLERTVPLGRTLLRLTDTAGVRGDKEIDRVEMIGIERTLACAGSSELILAVFDLSTPLDEEDRRVLEAISSSSAAKIAILTKSDCAHPVLEKSDLPDIFDSTLALSALTAPDEALDALKCCIEGMFTDEKINTSRDAIVASARQHAALNSALVYIDSAIEAYRLGIPADAASSDIELCLGAISELDGRAVSDEVVSDIFSRFCVGK